MFYKNRSKSLLIVVLGAVFLLVPWAANAERPSLAGLQAQITALEARIETLESGGPVPRLEVSGDEGTMIADTNLNYYTTNWSAEELHPTLYVEGGWTYSRGNAAAAVFQSDADSSDEESTLLIENKGFDSASFNPPLIQGWNWDGKTFEVLSDGRIIGKNLDFAEMWPSDQAVEPGDVLSVAPTGQLVRSASTYDKKVVGVYSTKPGFVGGFAPDNADPVGAALVALAGIVPVKATAEGNPIYPGDLLVASGVPGHAMKAGPNPPAGSVIGKALERLEAGKGKIQMLVVLR